MSEDFKDFIAAQTPTLTLEPALDMQDALLSKEEEKQDVPAEEDILSEEEKKIVENFSKQINVKDSNMIFQYGAGAQKKMADFSEAALKNARTQDLGEVGELITNVVSQLRNFDVSEEKGLFGFLKKGANKIDAMKLKYDKAENNVDKIVEMLQKHQMQLMKDVATLDKMYEVNLSYFKELTMYILAGKKKLRQVREGELTELMDKAQRSGFAQDAQAAKDLEEMCIRFEKKLHDLELTRTIAMQTAPQIRLVQNNDTTMAEKIQTTIVNTIPLWKSQMVLALGIANSNEAVKAQTAVTDMTNELLKKNAKMLHMSTVETAKQSERGIADMETLKQTNETLIQTLDEVMQIQREGRQKRQKAELEMRRMEKELRNKLLEIRR